MEKRDTDLRPKRPAGILQRMWQYIGSLFEPEEVEVTFSIKEGHMHYTYTKVDAQKHDAGAISLEGMK